jgi:hypothetical protein
VRDTVFTLARESFPGVEKEKLNSWLRRGAAHRRQGAAAAPLPAEFRDLRPADVFIPHYEHLTGAVIDVTICNSFHQRFINRSPEEFDPLAPYNEAHHAKVAKHGEAVTAQGHRLLPFVMGSAGGLGEVAISVVGRLAAGYALRHGLHPSYANTLLVRRLSAVCMRAQTAAIVCRGSEGGVMGF